MTNDKRTKKGTIKIDRRSKSLFLYISNRSRLNAMSLSMWQELANAVRAAEADRDIRAIVLSGEGNRAFAAGADITEFESQRDDPEQSARYSAAVAEAQAALSASRHPTIALIRGICMGGGMGLALACDIRYCLDDARFRMPAGRLGLGYALDGMRQFVDVIGPAATKELFFTARVLNGKDAERIGLVQESFGFDAFEVVTQKRLDAIEGLAPLTLRTAKLTVRHICEGAEAPSESAVAQAISACYRSDDYREGQKAFKEKREPNFMGK